MENGNYPVYHKVELFACCWHPISIMNYKEGSVKLLIVLMYKVEQLKITSEIPPECMKSDGVRRKRHTSRK
jgi:hypothetical protein